MLMLLLGASRKVDSSYNLQKLSSRSFAQFVPSKDLNRTLIFYLKNLNPFDMADIKVRDLTELIKMECAAKVEYFTIQEMAENVQEQVVYKKRISWKILNNIFLLKKCFELHMHGTNIQVKVEPKDKVDVNDVINKFL